MTNKRENSKDNTNRKENPPNQTKATDPVPSEPEHPTSEETSELNIELTDNRDDSPPQTAEFTVPVPTRRKQQGETQAQFNSQNKKRSWGSALTVIHLVVVYGVLAVLLYDSWQTSKIRQSLTAEIRSDASVAVQDLERRVLEANYEGRISELEKLGSNPIDDEAAINEMRAAMLNSDALTQALRTDLANQQTTINALEKKFDTQVSRLDNEIKTTQTTFREATRAKEQRATTKVTKAKPIATNDKVTTSVYGHTVVSFDRWGDNKILVLKAGPPMKYVKLSVGQKVGNWVLTDINNTRRIATFRNGSKQLKLIEGA